MRRTLLVHMPCAAVERPPLGLSLLKACLTDSGADCDVAYANLAFARALTPGVYRRLSSGFPQASLAGEWVFCSSLYDTPRSRWEAYLHDVVGGLPSEDRDLLRHSQALAEKFVADVFGSTPWDDYGVVGFTSSGDQNIAALALARRVKERNPKTVIVFGGPNWHDTMGVALHRNFPFVDAVFTGEADHTLPRFVHALAARDQAEWPVLPGVSLRGNGRSTMDCLAEPVHDLDALPVPDFSDYFSALSEAGLCSETKPILPVEASRGCWWGETEPCRFCGLVDVHGTYRVKSAGRVLSELRVTAARWPAACLDLVDSVVSRSFLEEVLPELAASPLGTPLFAEVRPELTREHMVLLAQAGITIQVGIESLNDHILRLMHKGTRTLENIRLLKWCREYGITIHWNQLYDVPGEKAADYADLAEVMPSVRYLPPPDACSPVRLDRFSTYFRDHETYGYVRRDPAAAFRHIYPFPPEELDEIAYSFVGSRDPAGSTIVSAMRRYRLQRDVRDWQQSPRGVGPRVKYEGGRHVIEDARPDATADGLVLDPLDHLLLRTSEDVASRAELLTAVRAWSREKSAIDRRAIRADHSAQPEGAAETAMVRALDDSLRRLVGHRLAVAIGDRCLSLAEFEAGT
jgi:ribosomal peptide maturation radical SAM protein 1